MKGQKGGKRDQLISNKFREDNRKTEEERINAAIKKLKDEKESLSENETTDFIENIDNRDYEEKEKSLENEDVVVSPLTDKDYQNDELVEEKEEFKSNEEENKEETSKRKLEEKEEKKQEEIEQNIKIEEQVIEETKQQDQEEIEQITENIEQEELAENVEMDLDKKLQEKEAMVFYELEKMIKQDYYDIKDLEYKIDIISTKAEQEVLKEELEKLKKELEELLKKFEILKDKYDYLDITKDLIGIHKLNDNYIETLIEDYKQSVYDDTEIENLLKKIEETKDYIGVVETLIITENKKNTLEDKIDDKCDELDIRDKDFAELEEKSIEVEKINKEIEKFTKEIEQINKDLESKVKETINITHKTERYTRLVPNINRMINATMMLMSASAMPHNLVGNLLRASFAAGAINNMAHILEPQETVKHYKEVTYTDYDKDILNNMDNIYNVNIMIDDALKNISDIRKNFEHDFQDYVGLVPGYKELITNLDTIQDTLEEQQYYIEKYDKQIKEQYNLNKEKMLIKDKELETN
ncbi:MAG: hypothetical protein ACI4OT_00055 [Bacilli bacterium]